MSHPSNMLSPRRPKIQSEEIHNKVLIFEGGGAPRPKKATPTLDVNAYLASLTPHVESVALLDSPAFEALPDPVQRGLAATCVPLWTQITRLHAQIAALDAARVSAKKHIHELKGEIASVSRAQASIQAELDQANDAHATVVRQLEATREQLGALRQAAPQGKVALVFTDVQGSTTQWEMHADVMAKALAMHNDLMRVHIERNAGYEVKTEGDAFMIAFADPFDAAKFCLDAQRALLDVDWPEELFKHPDAEIVSHPINKGGFLYRGLRVRMGIHVGEPTAEKDPVTTRMDYFGPMVNRSARVEGATHGGQIIVSEAVVQDLGHNMLPTLGDPYFNCLGQFQLKGLDTPETLYEMLPNALSQRKFPPPPVPPVPVPAPDANRKSGVALVVCDVFDGEELFELYPASMMSALRMFKDAVESTCRASQGYLSRVHMDAHLIAFALRQEAVRFAVELQALLLKQEWPAELAEHPSATRVEVDGRLVFAGLRARISIHCGSVTGRNDTDSDRFVYGGPALNVLGQIHHSTNGGQILATENALDFARDANAEEVGSGGTSKKKESVLHASSQKVRPLPKYTAEVIGVLDSGDQVSSIMPKAIKGRSFTTKLVSATAEKASLPPSGDVAIVSARIAGAVALWETDAAMMRKAVRIFERVVDEVAESHGAFVTASRGGRFQIAHSDCVQAVKMACALQSALMDAAWPESLGDAGRQAALRRRTTASNMHRRPSSDVVSAQDTSIDHSLFSGLCAAVAIEFGNVEKNAEQATPRFGEGLPLVTYGGAVGRYAEMAAKEANGGQTLIGVSVWDAVAAHVTQYRGVLRGTATGRKIGSAKKPKLTTVVVRDVGRVSLSNKIGASRQYFEVLPEGRLEGRTFPPRLVVPPASNKGVVVAYLSVPHITMLYERVPKAAALAVAWIERLVRSSAHKFDGYVARDASTTFCVAFDSVAQAIEWAGDVQLSLDSTAWNQDILRLKETAEGVRASIGMDIGDVRYESSPMSSKVDLFGHVVNNANMIDAAAHPGQILVTAPLWRQLEPLLRDGDGDPPSYGLWSVREIEHKYRFAGKEKDSDLFQVMPSELSLKRMFPPIGASVREHVTGETLRARVVALNEQNEEMTGKLAVLEDELEKASEMAKTLSTKLRSLERGNAKDANELLDSAFAEIEHLIDTQGDLQKVVVEANNRANHVQQQFDALSRQIELLESSDAAQSKQMQQQVEDLRLEYESRARAGGMSDEERRKIKRELADLKQASKRAQDANKALHAAEIGAMTAVADTFEKQTALVTKAHLGALKHLDGRVQMTATALQGEKGINTKETVNTLSDDTASFRARAKEQEEAVAKLRKTHKKEIKALNGRVGEDTLKMVQKCHAAQLTLAQGLVPHAEAMGDLHESVQLALVQGRSTISDVRGKKLTRKDHDSDSEGWTEALQRLEEAGSIKIKASKVSPRSTSGGSNRKRRSPNETGERRESAAHRRTSTLKSKK